MPMDVQLSVLVNLCTFNCSGGEIICPSSHALPQWLLQSLLKICAISDLPHDNVICSSVKSSRNKEVRTPRRTSSLILKRTGEGSSEPTDFPRFSS